MNYDYETWVALSDCVFWAICAKIGLSVWAVALLKNIKNNKTKKSQYPYVAHVASRPLIGSEQNLAELVISP